MRKLLSLIKYCQSTTHCTKGAGLSMILREPALHNNLDLHCIYYYSNMVQMCVCKYCICDLSAIVNESFIFTIVLMSHIPYLLTHLHRI